MLPEMSSAIPPTSTMRVVAIAARPADRPKGTYDIFGQPPFEDRSAFSAHSQPIRQAQYDVSDYIRVQKIPLVVSLERPAAHSIWPRMHITHGLER